MRLLILTQYFPPEVGAPQNRLFELAVRLSKLGVEITVLTAMPNYPKMVIHEKYIGKSYTYEEMEGLKIHRSYIYVSKDRSILKRLLNYFSFVFSSLKVGLTKTGKYDFILCESPPLFLGISAFLLAKRKNAKLIFNVSDLWPESAEKLGLVTNKAFLKISTWLEEFIYKKSAFVTGQTQGIVANIKNRFPNKTVYWLPNGVDLSYYDPSKYNSDWRSSHNFLSDDFIFLYGGIIGHAQGLEVILNAANILRYNSKIKFILLGDGPEKERLIKISTHLNLKNIYFYDPVSKLEMPNVVSACTATIVPLKRLDLFKGAIPSKIFESLAMKKPILLGVEGEAKELFIEEGKCGLFFTPESETELAAVILKMVDNPSLVEELGENARKYVDQKFNRNIIADDFYRQLKNNLQN